MKKKCACPRCSYEVDEDEYTFPYCPQCYANPKCK